MNYSAPVNRYKILAVTILAAAALAACSDDDDDDDTLTSPTSLTVAVAATTSVGSVPNEILVTATDYKFGGLPTSAPVGSKFTLQNASTKEVHEMVVTRIPDEVTQSVGELLAMPEEELDALVGQEEPVMVLVALPGEVGKAVVGDGVISAPGRYAVLCFIPVGADPAAVEDAMDDPDATGVPGSGPPHISKGMYGEITIS